LDRESFYNSADDDRLDGGADDGDEYELEPVDPEILESQRRRAQSEVIAAETALDIDKIYADRDSMEHLEGFAKDFRFQFQVKHMLLATAGLAILLSLGKLFGNFGAFLLVTLSLLAAAHGYLGWKDRKRLARIQEKRDLLVALNREKRDSNLTPEQARDRLAELDARHAGEASVERLLPQPSGKPLRIAYSMKEVMIATTVAALTLGLLKALGWGIGLELATGGLGLLAVAGLVVFAIGVEIPPLLVLGWWVTLLLYILMSFIGAFMGGK